MQFAGLAKFGGLATTWRGVFPANPSVDTASH